MKVIILDENELLIAHKRLINEPKIKKRGLLKVFFSKKDTMHALCMHCIKIMLKASMKNALIIIKAFLSGQKVVRIGKVGR